MKVNQKKVGAGLKQGIAGAIGLVGGTVAMRAIDGAAPTLPTYFSPIVSLLAGGVIFAGASNTTVKAAGVGLASAAAVEGVKRLTAGKTGAFATVHQSLPKLTGTRTASMGQPAMRPKKPIEASIEESLSGLGNRSATDDSIEAMLTGM
jgi:hypothetical protein